MLHRCVMQQQAESLSWIRHLEPETCSLIACRLRRHAVRQLAALHVCGAALAHAPSLDERASAIERAREELERLESGSELYRELLGRELLDEAAPEAAKVPIPSSWIDAAAAQLALSLAARIELGRDQTLAAPFAYLSLRALAEQTEHVNAARAALCDLCDTSQAAADSASQCLGRWLLVALDLLDAGDTRRAYLAQIEREIRVIGLKVALCSWESLWQ
ncbi:hypothetical protein [Sorangium sp. So ce1024]|uniref:hypothetical protein n=1 Tax=Sorangium sp. So ce1024 TaxID=3133327 RepID=UPI003F111D40